MLAEISKLQAEDIQRRREEWQRNEKIFRLEDEHQKAKDATVLKVFNFGLNIILLPIKLPLFLALLLCKAIGLIKWSKASWNCKTGWITKE